MRNHSEEIEQKIVNLTEQMASDQLAKWQPSNQLPSANFKGICRTFTKVLESVSDIWGPEVLSKFMVKVSNLSYSYVFWISSISRIFLFIFTGS